MFAIGDRRSRGYNSVHPEAVAERGNRQGLGSQRTRSGMSEDEGVSVTCWLGNLREGDLAAAQPLWERYFSRLVVVARGKLKRVRRSTAGEDEEDAALSAFNSFCGGAARGRFPQLADRGDLWRLLVVITARKAMAQAHREGRKKRGGGRVVDCPLLPPMSTDFCIP
jgi:hypothetical protein